MSDSIIYHESTDVSSVDRPFVLKQIIKAYDNQQGNYSNQFRIDTSQVFNSGKYAAYSEGYMTIPYVIAMKANADITNAAYTQNSFMVGMKNGFYQLINSIIVSYNNTNVVQLQEFTNMYINFKALTTWSQDDVAKYGASLGFFPDTASSYSYNNDGTSNTTSSGNGLTNNTVAMTALPQLAVVGYVGEPINEGFLHRLRATNFDTAAGMDSVIAKMTTEAISEKVGKSFFKNNGGAGDARIYYWNVMATIRLRDLHSFFENIPIIKGGLLNITVNYNASNFKINNTVDGVAPNTTLTLWSANPANMTITGYTNPLLVASAETNNPNYNIARRADKTLTIASNVSKVTIEGTTISHDIENVVTLYVPVYTFDSLYLDQYLSLNETKTFTYRDIWSKLYSGQSSKFSFIVNSSITNPKALILIPVLSAANNSTLLLNPVQSPFDTCPATTSPLINITNFNIQLSGLNLWSDNITYEFDNFLNEFRSANSVNGGSVTGLTSGLLDYHKWSTGYKFYYADLSRRNVSDDAISKSIQISGFVEGSYAIDIYVFIEYEKSITLNTVTGELLNITGN